MYTQKCLLMFYNSFAKSVICYGLLIYGSATESILKKIESAQRRNIRAIFLKKQIDSPQEILQRNKIPTVFELFLVENEKEIFRQLRQNGELQKNSIDIPSQNAYCTR